MNKKRQRFRKFCIKCGKPFTPTGKVENLCFDCWKNKHKDRRKRK